MILILKWRKKGGGGGGGNHVLNLWSLSSYYMVLLVLNKIGHDDLNFVLLMD